MVTNRQLVAKVSSIAQEFIEENGYEASVDEYYKLEVNIGDNGCVNYTLWCNGFYGDEEVKIYVDLKYDAKPDGTKNRLVPDVIYKILDVDGVSVIKEYNANY